jgi:acetyl-CoA carboxylase biotin carboxyl carrier protein
VGRLIVEPRPSDRDVDATTAELLALIDRLEDLLQRSSLQELEVEAGETTLVLRTPAAVAPAIDPRLLQAMAAAGTTAAPGESAGGAGGAAGSTGSAAGSAPGTAGPDGATGASTPSADLLERHAVLAPLTGIFYGSPTPEASAYVRVGRNVQEGQVIGLIEAMKLFNEIKSDATGTVTRIVAESGTLVKAKSPLIELERA